MTCGGRFLRRGDTRGAGSNESLNTLEVGVRAAVTPHVLPIKPYVEALVGYGGLTTGQGRSRQDGSHATYQFLGGLDLTFLPRLDWRVVEFSYGRLSGLGDAYAPKTLSTGLVFSAALKEQGAGAAEVAGVNLRLGRRAAGGLADVAELLALPSCMGYG